MLGQKVSLLETMEIKQAQAEKSQCQGCLGLPCRKAEKRGQYPCVMLEMGRIYITERRCRYMEKREQTTASVKSGIPRRYASKTYADYKETASNVGAIKKCRRYAAEKPDFWLYVYGGCGTGKTYLVSLLGKDLIAAGMDVIFRDFADILEEMKSSFDDTTVAASTIMEKYRTCEVLIMDDVGTGYFRDWGVSVLHQIINERYNLGLRTIITSNYDMAGLQRRLSVAEEYAAARIISRLRGESLVLYMGEADFRNGAE